MKDSYDAIVVGSGAGGGIVACVLAEAGQTVLLLERGKTMSYTQVSLDHVRNHRFGKYGNNTGPELEGHPRVFIDSAGKRHVLQPHQGGYMNNAMVEGGGTLIYGAQAWRFLPKDFRMASIYGTPAGSSLSDWPITYDELEPYYERAEWEIGVSCDHTEASQFWPRKKPFPMPPMEDRPPRPVLRKAAHSLGWKTMPVPVLINSVPYNGRQACVHCGCCIGFACPSDGKNGSQNTVIPRALATGLCDRVTQAMAERIDTDSQGKVIGVTMVVMIDGQPQRKSVRAKRVIVSGGAIETTRLLMNSTSTHHPNGLGNEHDYLGRNLQGHVYVGAVGYMQDSMYDGRGPGVSIATLQFNHGNPGVVGGGLLADEFIKLPIIFWNSGFPPGEKKWGLSAKRFMREKYVKCIHVQGPVQEIPNPEARVQVDPTVRDRYGIPVVKLSGKIHQATSDVADFLREKAMLWLKTAGAENTWTWGHGMGLTGGQHQAGTARMGNDVKASVTDSWGRVHGHDNLYIADGSLHVTNGGMNPVLTIMALAFRVGEGIVANSR